MTTKKLSVGTKLAFGAGDLGAAIVATINGFFLNAFLLDVAGLNPNYAGAIFILVKIWDSINDPIIGTLTDRTNTRWGKRRPWLLFGAVPFGLAFFLHWLVPPDFGQVGKFVYYLIVALLLDTAFTAVNVPYTALTPALTQDQDERTSLNAYRFSFSIVGGTIAAALHVGIVGMSESATMGNAIAAAIWAVFIAGSALLTFAFTKEEDFSAEADDEIPFFDGLKMVFKNKPFIYVTVLYLLTWLAIQFVQANLLFYARYWVKAEDQFQFIIVLIQGVAFIFLMVWGGLSQRIGKKKVYYMGAAIWITSSLLLYTVAPGQITYVMILAGIAGAGVSVGYLIPWSMLPDVIEYNQLETGQRNEGLFYSFFVFLQKLGLSLGLGLSNFALGAVGYISSEGGVFVEQPTAVLTTLRVFVSIVPAVILLLSLPVVYYYPITREKYQEIQAALAEKP